MLLNHHLDDPYPTNEVQNVAEFLLSATLPNMPSSPAGYPSSIAITKAVKQKLVDIAYLIRKTMKTEVLKLVTMALADHQRMPATSAPAPRCCGCHFCGKEDCWIKNCKTAEEY
jgi:hypothetical protein